MEAMAPQLVREKSVSAKLKAGHEETLGLVLQTTSVRASQGGSDYSYTTKASGQLAQIRNFKSHHLPDLSHPVNVIMNKKARDTSSAGRHF